jgi:hypothetical protein
MDVDQKSVLEDEKKIENLLSFTIIEDLPPVFAQFLKKKNRQSSQIDACASIAACAIQVIAV